MMISKDEFEELALRNKLSKEEIEALNAVTNNCENLNLIQINELMMFIYNNRIVFEEINYDNKPMKEFLVENLKFYVNFITKTLDNDECE